MEFGLNLSRDGGSQIHGSEARADGGPGHGIA